MGYSGSMKVKGSAYTSGSRSEVEGSGSFTGSTERIGETLASSLPHGIGHAMDSAVDLHKHRLENEGDKYVKWKY